ncbi:glycosyltransferase family 4 protein [Caenimonas aquaedulcis]|uniref:Glycosyltransferase family 4 protein n=1 Tax=Caenimonas aquaedulcis TaxID=2793270 RepID=A0A931MHH3_9BURK|nr:glycosyltransferase family 4 protein [Caenimonas aquaedulcis]MBG9389071.1 glycosyltransferase family 4 protein [Caenimonas aquaedulcis]
MPRLLVLSQTHNHWGGIEAWMSEVLPFLQEGGWDIHYGLALGRRHNDPEQFVAHHPYMRQVHLMDGRAATPSARQAAVGRLVRQVAPDAVMPLAIGDALPALVAERARGGKARLLCAVHSLHTGTLADLVGYRHVIDTVVVVSGLQHRWLAASQAFAPERVRWVRNGVPVAAHPRAPRAGPLRVGYVGRIENSIKRSGDVAAVLRACVREGTPIAMTVAGDGPDRAATEAAVRAIEPRPPTRFLGFQERAVLYREVYPQLDALVLASVTEGSPLALIEAMQNGVVPVVSEYFGFAAEGLLRPGHNCLSFPVGDVALAASHLDRLSRDPALLAGLSARARESVAGRYDRSTMLQGWRDAFAALSTLPPLAPAAVPPRVAYGRLDRWGVPAALANWLRRHGGAPQGAADGFDEWPGSVYGDGGLPVSIDNSLRAIEAECAGRLAGNDRAFA